MIDFVDILLLVKRQADGRIVSQLSDSLADRSFKMNLSSSTSKLLQAAMMSTPEVKES